MILVLAEKTKAARRIAEILSGGRYRTLKIRNHPVFVFSLKGKEFYVVPLRGHVLDVDFPEEHSRWSLEGLHSLVDAPLKLKVMLRSIVEVIKQLKPRVEAVIIATDADREGEAIGLEVVDYLLRDKPVYRAWFSALTPAEIKRAFSNLRSPQRTLAEAAFARRDVDLLWGAVLTRALSLTSGRRGRDFLSVGRVQTPTLALVVEREREIRAFTPKTYYILRVLLRREDETFWASYPEKIWSEQEARVLRERVRSTACVEDVKVTRKNVPRPVPFDTTTFLSEANKILNIPPKEALDIAEDLYMSGLISYPRTDNQTYPLDLPIRDILSMLSSIKEYSELVKLVPRTYRPSSGRKTEDHPPIHPVGVPRSPLPKKHALVYDLIVRRFLATLMNPAVVEDTEVKLNAGVPLVSQGRRVISPGWTVAYPVKLEETPIPYLRKGEEVSVVEKRLEKRKTKPPQRYTPGELVKKMESLGLGTKSTRAEIVAKLFRRGYITGKKRIRPTPLGEAVYDLLKVLAPETLEPSLTARLEERLNNIEKGAERRERVVTDTREALRKLVDEFLSNRDKVREAIAGGDKA